MLVIAKAYGDEPLERIAASRSKKLTYLVNPSAPDAKALTEVSGVGFPNRSVFQYDPELMEKLRAAWELGDEEELMNLWEDAQPLDS